LLSGYWSGVPAVREQGAWVPRRLWRRFVRYEAIDVPSGRTRWAPWVPALRQASGLLPQSLGARIDLLACRAFDRWAARRLHEPGATAVLACEISALTTFRRAKQLGMTTLLDAPSFHHAAQDRLHGFTEPPRVHRRITAVKDEEIRLADHVITVSSLARATYLDAGVAADKVHAVSLGADIALFEQRRGTEPATGRFRFLYCGAMLIRKGFDVLAAAFRDAVAKGLDAELCVIGPSGDAASHAKHVPRERLQLVGPLTQAALAEEMRAADCLVLPSRNDSFGMVVAESLACGVPAIVSDQVGARDLIEPGRTGFVVPAGDVGALTAVLLDCASRRSELRAMAGACRGVAETATWEAYHARLADLVSTFLAARA
jgi:glycosyltransferase involved in cell wall biosynthesis